MDTSSLKSFDAKSLFYKKAEHCSQLFTNKNKRWKVFLHDNNGIIKIDQFINRLISTFTQLKVNLNSFLGAYWVSV